MTTWPAAHRSSRPNLLSRGAARTTSTVRWSAYAWFTDWGRDTMIALPGLMLASEQFDVVRARFLADVRPVLRQGDDPERVSLTRARRPQYNTVDASLWFKGFRGEMAGKAR